MASKPAQKQRPTAKVNATSAPVEIRTEGQRLLVDVPATHAEIADRIGATKQAVSYWRRGQKIPGTPTRAALRDAYGIDPTTWERAPTGGGRAATSSASEPPGVPVSGAKPPRDRSEGSKPTTLEEVEDQLAMLRKLQQQTEGLLASERVRLADSVGKLLAIKARLERDQELLEDRVVREHPTWSRIRQRLFAALTPYPEAARAVAEALAGVA